MFTRRGIISGLISFLAAPAIVRASSLMPVRALVIAEKPLKRIITVVGFDEFGNRKFELLDYPIGLPMPSVFGDHPWQKIESISVGPLVHV
jgi:hypothetical protein